MTQSVASPPQYLTHSRLQASDKGVLYPSVQHSSSRSRNAKYTLVLPIKSQAGTSILHPVTVLKPKSLVADPEGSDSKMVEPNTTLATNGMRTKETSSSISPPDLELEVDLDPKLSREGGKANRTRTSKGGLEKERDLDQSVHDDGVYADFLIRLIGTHVKEQLFLRKDL
ncbi:hypothetical protein BDZ45DRAFT_689339 [Acephala macrosclerotiorum]|nr:hypothetical protein BDZ45DRAFT_689339 [Acephala macrosclerotiorum]